MNQYTRIHIIVFFAFLGLMHPSLGQPVTVHYADGKKLEILSLREVSLIYRDVGYREKKEVPVMFENTLRTVPHAKMKQIRVLTGIPHNVGQGLSKVTEATIEIETVTGVKVKMTDFILFYVSGMISDPLTGEVKLQKVWFGDEGKMNVSHIDFHSKEE